MSTKTKYPIEVQREALVLQCLFASVAQKSPTVGEVSKFLVTHGGFHSSSFQVGKVLADLQERGYVTTMTEKHGRKTWTRYMISKSGALHLMSCTKHLPKHIRDYMIALHDRVAAGALALISEYLDQGVKS